MNQITELRDKRKRSRRAPMPVSKKPRRKYDETTGPGPDYSSRAGRLISSFFDWGRSLFGAATVENAMRRDAREEKFRNRPKIKVLNPHTMRRHKRNCVAGPIVRYAPSAPAGSREAERRKRQGVLHAQHPSVVERFKAQIAAAA